MPELPTHLDAPKTFGQNTCSILCRKTVFLTSFWKAVIDLSLVRLQTTGFTVIEQPKKGTKIPNNYEVINIIEVSNCYPEGNTLS